jgi:glycosyltransferase involved in cell wall biosynthesis
VSVRVMFVVPAYESERTVGAVVRELARTAGSEGVIVVDDGSRDATSARAKEAGGSVLVHPENRGKGAALRTGFVEARKRGADVVVSVDADGQHPPAEAVRLARHPAPRSALVLGVRDLERDGAPKASRFSNAFSNVFLSGFGGRTLHDTQCGLRRYPLPETLLLGGLSDGYAYEAEVVLRAARLGFAIEEVPITVVYPPPSERLSHFHVARDPARIVVSVLGTVVSVPRREKP